LVRQLQIPLHPDLADERLEAALHSQGNWRKAKPAPWIAEHWHE
jgi:hypothetical protein